MSLLRRLDHSLDGMTNQTSWPPDLPIPNGEVPDFESAVGIRLGSIIFFSFVIVLSVSAFAIHMYAKIRLIKKLTLEDYLLMLAMICLLAFISMGLEMDRLGLGRHLWHVTLARGSLLLQWTNLSQIIFDIGLLFSKLAVLLQLKRIFVVQKTGFLYWFTWFLILLHCLSSIAFIPPLIWRCIPRERFWNPTVPGRCVENFNPFIMVAAVIPALIDWLSLIIPAATIRTLQVAKKTKIRISVVFAVGLSTCIISLARVAYSNEWLYQPDATYYAQDFNFLAGAELASICIIACTPMMPRFFGCFRQKSLPQHASVRLNSLSQRKSKSTNYSRTMDTGFDIADEASSQASLPNSMNQPAIGIASPLKKDDARRSRGRDFGEAV